MTAVKILIPFRFEVDNKAVSYEPGIAELPNEAVDAFVRAGYIALIEDEPAIKIVGKPKSAAKASVKKGGG